ncbi:uncharacterized protein [Chironomus tepperi]|uniref:uncharacterized protein n=1 Tax=Chironomus tepperi TaxID=113505 RepID=UPI00391F17B4
MNRLILVALAIFLVSPTKSEIDFGENAFASIKSFFGFEEKPYIPTGTNHMNSPAIDSTVGSIEHPKCQSLKVINYLHEIQLNTTEWKCIEKILRNATKDPGNFTSLLLIATKEAIVDQIKSCYADKSEGIDWFGWWNDWWNNFTQTDFWKIVTDHYWYIIIAAVATLVVLTCLCKLCCVICKKKRDEELLE